MAEGWEIVAAQEVPDVLGDYPGEMRFLTSQLGSEQVAFTYRRLEPETGSKGSYGHRHKNQEEIYFVVRGKVQFKIGDEEFEAGPHTAVRVGTQAFRSVHNDGPEEAELIICSPKAKGDEAEVEMTDTDFWPAD